MANPNIINSTSIYGVTTYLIPSTTNATAWTGLTPATNTVNKVNSIVAANVTSSAATVTVSVNSATGGSGTAYRIAFQISVPPNASLVILDKLTALYIQDNQSVVVTVGTANAIELVAMYEAIT